ncbi:MAG: response regulator [Desulfobacula sp.]
MKKILVIDDEAAIRVLLAKILDREGFFVITASDGKEGMKLFNKEPADLVVTDLIMPEKEGVEIIIELRKEYPGVPVIAISGGGRNSPESYLNMAKLLGAYAVLEKPVQKETFLEEVRKALKL